MVGPQLTELSFDLQVQICKFLQPPEILALRQTSKAFHQVTSLRIVWIHALKRICRDNFLFLPTFPIDDMSIAELERAATAPFRWIALSSSTVRNDSDALKLRITRTIEKPIASVIKRQREGLLSNVYLVPGGRYLVISGWRFLGVWDLGNVSGSAHGKPIGIWETMDNIWWYLHFVVHPTPDGLGFRILTVSGRSIHTHTFYVFEIYPQQETPKLAKIADIIIDFQANSPRFTYSLSGNHVVIYERMKGTFIVWDFIANTVASWSIAVHVDRALDQSIILRVTETVVIIHDGRKSLLIFEIPPLKARETPFHINGDLPIVTPALSYVDEDVWFHKPDGWYSGDLSSLPLCIDIPFLNKTRRCKLDYTCDSSTIRLVPISKERCASFKNLGEYRICDDRFVNFSNRSGTWGKDLMEIDVCGGFGPSSSNRQARSLSQVRDMNFTLPFSIYRHSSFCPVSARFIFIVKENIVISDFLYEGI